MLELGCGTGRVAVPVARTVGGTFAMDLVPNLQRWSEYDRRVSLRGRRRGHTRTAHRFSLVFRTLSVRQMTGSLRRAGFTVETVSGDYTGGE